MGKHISYSDEIELKLQFHQQNKNRIFEFQQKILPLLNNFNYLPKSTQIKFLIEIFKHIDTYSDILFNPYSKYKKLVITLKKKLIEFKTFRFTFLKKDKAWSVYIYPKNKGSSIVSVNVPLL